VAAQRYEVFGAAWGADPRRTDSWFRPRLVRATIAQFAIHLRQTRRWITIADPLL